MRFKCVSIVLLIFVPFCLLAQIVPAGLGKTNYGSSLAYGVKQDLDTMQNRGWTSSTYIAMARVSGSETHNPLKKQGIFILDQEFYNQFHENWEHSIAASYRRQNLYGVVPELPAFKNEFRLYGRFSYLLKRDKYEITPTLRQEFIKYYNPDFTDYTESFRLRTRLRLKLAVYLSPSKEHRVTLYSEQLFSSSYYVSTDEWREMGYNDSRFSVYYSYLPESIPFAFNIGYMSNLIGIDAPFLAQYFAIDIIWKNPF